jgi:UDP-3-O-[3-hydroxymyristoyl] glucosamine N-acyltransferase
MKATDIANLFQVEWRGETAAEILRVSAPADADGTSLVFAEDDRALHTAEHSSAGCILASEASSDPRVMVVRFPKLAFAQVGRALAPRLERTMVDASAAVAATVRLGERVQIAAGAVVEDDCVLGDDVVIAAGAKVLRGVVLGHRVVVQAGAVLGSTGFGYVRDPETGEYVLFPQQGALVVEDDVEIGANSTVDRGALGETRIGRGTKIDNLVHIGHNCRIGRNVVIAAQAGISGSCVVEDGAVLAGQVGISDHCHIGPGVILGGQAGVYRGATVEGPGQMFAGTPAEPLKDHLRGIARVRRLK